MKTTFAKDTPQSAKADAFICFVPKFDKVSDKTLRSLDEATNGAVSKVLETEEFSGKEGEMAAFYRPAGYEVGRVILLGLGDKAKIGADNFRRAMGRAGRYRPLTSASKAAISFAPFEKPENFQAAIEGYLLGGYQMLEYKTGENAKDDRHLDELIFISDNKAMLGRMEKAVARGTVIAEGQVLVRKLASTPSNDLTPTLYAEKAKELAKQYGFECRVLDEAAIKREKMGAFLSVTVSLLTAAAYRSSRAPICTK
jgi:leucyl aminopeptidase